MTFNEAYEELKEMANDRPFSLQYDKASFLPTIAITAYIEGVGHGLASITYQGAIDNMRLKLGDSPTRASVRADKAPSDEEAR